MNLKNIGMAVRQPFESQDDASPPKTGFAFAEFEPPGPSHPPTPTNNAFFVFLALSNRLTTPKILICPADHRKLATNTWQWATLPTSDSARNPSYFAGTSPRLERPQDILAGDRNLLIPSVGLDFKAASNYNRIVSISWADIPPAYSPNLGWSRELHNSGGNVLLSDGSVQQESNGRVQDQLRDTLNVSTNGIELFFPAL